MYTDINDLLADFAEMKEQLRILTERVAVIEQENSALIAYVKHDTNWHTGVLNGESHIPWDSFVEQWKSGWRPAEVIR